jgi:biopolymer transport protein ExbD
MIPDSGLFPDGNAPAPEVNTTPLIDVLLVLLIMIIVTVPLKAQLTELALPVHATANTEQSRTILLDIGEDGGLRWGGVPLATSGELDAALDHLVQTENAPTLRLRAADDTAYGRVIPVLAAIRRHGVRRFALAASTP